MQEEEDYQRSEKLDSESSDSSFEEIIDDSATILSFFDPSSNPDESNLQAQELFYNYFSEYSGKP